MPKPNLNGHTPATASAASPLVPEGEKIKKIRETYHRTGGFVRTSRTLDVGYNVMDEEIWPVFCIGLKVISERENALPGIQREVGTPREERRRSGKDRREPLAWRVAA